MLEENANVRVRNMVVPDPILFPKTTMKPDKMGY